jgi:hypothetical protein
VTNAAYDTALSGYEILVRIHTPNAPGPGPAQR